MMSKFTDWYKNLSAKKKVASHFAMQWIYWLLSIKFLDNVWPSEKPKTIQELIFKATWMALWMTLFFQWKNIKLIFKKNESK